MTTIVRLLAGPRSGWRAAEGGASSGIPGRVDLSRDLLRDLEGGSVAFGGQEIQIAAGTTRRSQDGEG